MSKHTSYTGPRAFSQEEARELLGGISRSTLHRLIESGLVRAIHIGRRLMIPESEIARIAEEGTH